MNTDPSNFEPEPANGEGAEVFSLPELFYLKNAKLIEEWANLKSAAAAAQDRWLVEYASAALEKLAEDYGCKHVLVSHGPWRSSCSCFRTLP